MEARRGSRTLLCTHSYSPPVCRTQMTILLCHVTIFILQLLGQVGVKQLRREVAVADETLLGACPSLYNPHPTQAPSNSGVRLCIPGQGRPPLDQPARVQMTSPLNESDSQSHEYVYKKATQHLNLTPRKFNFTWGTISLWPLLPCPDVSLI